MKASYTLKGQHSNLVGLYNGPDPVTFRKLVCHTCGLSAIIEPKQCTNLYCKYCPCPCGDQHKPHFIIDVVINQATFLCPYGCNKSILLHKLEDHILHRCRSLFKPCPNICDPELLLHVTDIDQHLLTCPEQLVLCTRCNLDQVKLKLLQEHQVTECDYLTVCGECNMEYRVKQTHGDLQCVDFLQSLVFKLENGIKDPSPSPCDQSLKQYSEPLEYQHRSVHSDHSLIFSQNEHSHKRLKGKRQKGQLRVSPLLGGQGKHYFEFPQNLQSLIGTVVEQYPTRHLNKIHCSIQEAISSIQLEFNDGVKSPHFGQSQGFNISLDIPENIVNVKVRHNVKTASIQSILFESGQDLVEFNAKMTDGRVTDIALAKGEKIVGVFGFCWSSKQPEIVGLGFVIWNNNL